MIHPRETRRSREPAETGRGPRDDPLPPGPAIERLLALQRSAGNAEVARALSRQPVNAVEGEQEKSRRPPAARPADAVTHAAASKKGSASNAYGTFAYEITKNAGDNGCDARIAFEAFKPEISSTKITFIQAVKSTKAGGATFYPNNDTAYYSLLDPGTGQRTDATKSETDPFYNYEDRTKTDEATGTTGASKTTMTDEPALRSFGGERGQKFETAPFVLEGNDEGEFLGTLTWGWDIDAAGKFTLDDPAVHDEVSSSYGAALVTFISAKHTMTKTGTTPARATLDMPGDVCRDLTAAERLQLKPFVDYVKGHASARLWVVGRYKGTAPAGPLGQKVESQLAGALDNARGVQQHFKTGGIADSSVHATAAADASVADRRTAVDVTVIDT